MVGACRNNGPAAAGDAALTCATGNGGAKGRVKDCGEKMSDALFGRSDLVGPANAVLFGVIKDMLEYVSNTFDYVSKVLNSGHAMGLVGGGEVAGSLVSFAPSCSPVYT